MSVSDVPSPVRVPAAPGEPLALASELHTRLPNVWVGYAITFLTLALALPGVLSEDNADNIDLPALALILFLVGWFFWLFFVHRVHRVLREATMGAYSVSPRKAVGFQFIPLYSLVWVFVWPRRIAKFVNNQGGAVRMSGWLPGIALFLASFLGAISVLGPLHLLILFATGHYFTRKLKKVLPPFAASVVVHRQEHQLGMAVSAGVGAVFAFKLFQAFWNPDNRAPHEMLHTLLAISIVSVGVILFLEPLAEYSRGWFGLEEHHTHKIRKSWQLKIAFFLILALTSLAHGFLHKQIEFEMNKDALGCLIGMIGATLVSSCITYAWVSGASREKSRAAFFGLLTGLVVGLFVAGMALSGNKTQASSPESLVEEATSDPASRGVAEVNSPLPPQLVINAEKNLKDRKVRQQLELDVRKILMPWTVLGLIGGLAIDFKWGRRPSRNVAMVIFGTAIVLFPTFAYLAARFSMQEYLPPKTEIISHIIAVGGWALALSIFPFADALLGHHRQPAAAFEELHRQPAA